jgi:predicted small lipoprotein YifL
MKKTLLIAAALVLAGCGKKAETPPAAEGGMAADSSSTMNMSHDSTAAAPMSSDTTMARDTTKK